MTTETSAGQGTVEAGRQILANDLRRLGKDAEALLTQVVNSTVEDVAATRGRIATKLGTATQHAGCTGEAADAYVRENPWQAMGLAAVAGFVAALLLSRR
jgi:ElaB/YqjD/DUF883 family membrane-anchored ribosome-binding protein